MSTLNINEKSIFRGLKITLGVVGKDVESFYFVSKN